MHLSREDSITKALQDPQKITKIMQEGINAALLQHKRAGQPICIWQDNKVVWIQPEDIKIPTQNDNNGDKK